MTEKITILGAGLVGTLLSISLKLSGYQVKIYEKRSDPRIATKSEGRSINLALSLRGIKALERVGLDQKVLASAVPMKGRMIHVQGGQENFLPYGKEGQNIYSISRAGLNQLLVEEAENRGVEIVFGHKCNNVDFEKKTISLLKKGGEIIDDYSFLFGADGAFSSLRYKMQHAEHFNFSQEYLDYGYKELTISSGHSHGLDPHCLHIWPREDFMLIALPNTDHTFTCTLFLRLQGPSSFDEVRDNNTLMTFFSTCFPDVLQRIPDLQEQFFLKPPSGMIMIKCKPWAINPHVMLLGDAAHAIVPFYGQGMNAGFEDVDLLSREINQHGSLSKAVSVLNATRKADTDAIGQLALDNFIEMRDLVAEPMFILRKKIEGKIMQQYPQYKNIYSLVTFSQTPYLTALEESKKQNAMFNEILDLQEAENAEIPWDAIQTIVTKYYPELN